jgi:hypothetical protein
MSADIILFVPRANPKADRAFWKGPEPIEIMAVEILNDDAFKFGDAEFVAPQKDPA